MCLAQGPQRSDAREARKKKKKKKDDKTSILFTVTCNIPILHTGNNFLQSQVCSESIL